MSDKLVTLNNLREFKAKCDTTYAKVGTEGGVTVSQERYGTIYIENVNLFSSETQSSIGEITICLPQFFITLFGLTEENQQEWWAQQKANGDFGSMLIGFMAYGLEFFVQKTNSALGGRVVSYDDTKVYAQIGATLEAFYYFSKDKEAWANSEFSFGYMDSL